MVPAKMASRRQPCGVTPAGAAMETRAIGTATTMTHRHARRRRGAPSIVTGAGAAGTIGMWSDDAAAAPGGNGLAVERKLAQDRFRVLAQRRNRIHHRLDAVDGHGRN